MRYVLEGSVQRSGERMRVNVQLIDAETGAHLWAERFDKPVAELFDMQDEIVARIANELSAQIVSVEARRAEKDATRTCSIIWFRGYDWINRGINPESLAKARECFAARTRNRSRQRQRDPRPCLRRRDLRPRCVRSRAIPSASRGGDAGAQGARHGARNATAHYCLGLILLSPDAPKQAIAELEQALSLDPNLAFAHAQIGFAKAALGHAEETEGHVLEAMRLSPRDIGAYVWCDFLGDRQESCSGGTRRRSRGAGKRSRRTAPTRSRVSLRRRARPFRPDRRGRARSAGRAQARAGLHRPPLLGRRRSATIRRIFLSGERILEGMRLAGVPEG